MVKTDSSEKCLETIPTGEKAATPYAFTSHLVAYQRIYAQSNKFLRFSSYDADSRLRLGEKRSSASGFHCLLTHSPAAHDNKMERV